MKKHTVISLILFALSLIAALTPVLTGALHGGEVGAYASIVFVLLLFGVFIALAMLRKYRSDKELAEKLALLKWQLPQGYAHGGLSGQAVRTCIITAAVVAAVFMAVVLISKPESVFVLAMLALGALLAACGIAVLVLYLRQQEYGGQYGFMLCHNALFLCGTRTVLNGVTTAIYDVAFSRTDMILRLGILQHKHQFNIDIPVPPDNADATEAFIADLNAHFEGGKDNA